MNAPEVTAWRIKPNGHEWMFSYVCPICGSDLRSPVNKAGEFDDCPDCGRFLKLPTLTNEEIASYIDGYRPDVSLNVPSKLLWIRFIPVKLHLVLPVVMGFVGAAVCGNNTAVIFIFGGIGAAIGIFLQLLKYEASKIATIQRKDEARSRAPNCRDRNDYST